MLRLTEDRCRDSPFSGATSRPTKPVSRAKHSMRLVAGVNFRSTRSWSVAEQGRAIYESFCLCYEAYRAPSLTSFNLHRLSHYPRKLDRVYDEFLQAVDPSCRIDRRLSLAISTPAGQGRWAQDQPQSHAALPAVPDVRPAAICPRLGRWTCRPRGIGLAPAGDLEFVAEHIELRPIAG